VVHVHDLVDFVTEESRRAGKAAASHVLNGKRETAKDKIRTLCGNGIAYTVPQFISRELETDSIPLLFRVRNVYRDVHLVIKSGEKVLQKKKKSHMAPGEMERVILTKAMLQGNPEQTLSIEIVEGEI